MARLSSFFASYLPLLALCAIAAGFIPIVGPSLRTNIGETPMISWQTLAMSVGLVMLGAGYLWFQSKGADGRRGSVLERPNRLMLVVVLAVLTAVPAGAGVFFSKNLFLEAALVPGVLLFALLPIWLINAAIEDMAVHSVPPWVENPSASKWLQKTEARWKRNFRNGCFVFSGALGLTSLFLWGAGHFDKSALPSLETFHALGGLAALCLYAGWVTNSFIKPGKAGK